MTETETIFEALNNVESATAKQLADATHRRLATYYTTLYQAAKLSTLARFLSRIHAK